MKKRNADYWHWYPNSYPTDKGIHFSFTTMNFALRFMRKFETNPFYKTTDITRTDWYSLKILNQDKPTEEQFTWLKRCKIDKKEKSMTFEEYKRGYKFWEGKKDSKGRTIWYVASKDYKDGHGYYAYAADEITAIWILKRTFEGSRERGEL